MAVDSINYPGSTFLDMDCESSGLYEGKDPGTVSISGYSEEYREHQLLKNPLLNLAYQGSSLFPEVALDKIVARIQKIQLYPNVEDDEGFKQFCGFSQYVVLGDPCSVHLNAR